ncbi:MAG TPA: chemotaxis protein CheB [Ktedonobacterales bacterium]|nr:chemotaxis protein CheB [Ktedonobacterales bacterium]
MATTRDETGLYGLVVVGSSAGGIEALSTLVATLPADFPAPLVLAQHLDPSRPSHLAEILARRSALPVRVVVDDEHLEPGVVYVVPSDRHVEIIDHVVRLRADGAHDGQRPKPSVDRLLTSAAQAYGERLIAVILTGTGSDGASGARAVKEAGGTVIIENPATAAYPGMPESLAPTSVDLVSDLERIGPLLHDLLTGVRVPMQPEAEEPLQALLTRVREQSDIDFSHYKRPTILRRLQRRMITTGMRQLADYADYLTQHPEEYPKLVGSFLINVTEFFRDASLFAALRERVLPELIAHARTRNNLLRIWSAGCATGEEAYSLAILVAEALGDELEQFTIQIFATDLDEDAVAFARRGIYPAAALGGIPEDVRSRAFTPLDGSFEVVPRVRGLVIFGQHDLGQRAPFPHIDLVLCRNVLIYFAPELQRRALQLFAFALREAGYLVLGKAETVNPAQAYFKATDEHLKIYQRRGDRVLPPIERVRALDLHRRTDEHPENRPAPTWIRSATMAAQAEPPGTRPAGVAESRTPNVSERLGSLVLDAPLGVVVVNQEYDIQIINPEAIRLLGIFTSTVGKDLLHVTQGVPIAPLRAALDSAFHRSADMPNESASIVTVQTMHGEQQHLLVACYPHVTTREGAAGAGSAAPAEPDLVLMLVSDMTHQVRQQQAAAEMSARTQADHLLAQSSGQSDIEQRYRDQIEENARLRAQVAETSALNHTLLHANHQLVEANLDLRGANEDLLVGHEEAAAGTEEIKTLNEELQATNEELVTVNEELEATIEELHTANDDLTARSRELQRMAVSLEQQHRVSEAARTQLAAILLSMGDALMVLDPGGVTVLTNAAYTRMFGRADAVVVAEDPLGHPLPPEMQPQRRAAAGSSFTMQFARTAPDGTRQSFEATGQPIVNGNTAQGSVVTIRDITERRLRLLQEEFLAVASHELRAPLTSLLMALQLLAKQPLASATGQDMQTAVRLALRQGQRLRVLVNDLLDVERAQQDKLHLQLAPVDLGALLAETVETARLDTQGQTIVLDGSTEPLVVMADATRLEQIILNLLTNAIKYAPGTQRIDVRLRRADGSTGSAPERGEAELQVQDYGPGISATDLPQIFTRYFQSPQAGSTARDGLGLGLYITKELVTAHEGSITASSVIGEGTIFTVRLPLLGSGESQADTSVREHGPSVRRMRSA